MNPIYFRHEKIREGQKQLIQDALKVIKEQKNLIAHASTGIGKTDASISAALKYAIDNKKTIFFLTPKISQHKIALKVIKELTEKYELNETAVDIVGKKNMCADKEITIKETDDFYELCRKRRTKGKCPYYENIMGTNFIKRQAANRRLAKIKQWHGNIKEHDELIKFCENLTEKGFPAPVCPYETALKIARESTLIIADYYQVLNPYIADTFLQKINKKLEDSIIIIDEAHNLPDRMRKALSSSLNKKTIKKAIQESLLMENKLLAIKLNKVLKEFEKIEKELDTKERIIYKEEIPYLNHNELNDLYQTGTLFLENTNRSRSNCLRILRFYEQWMKDSNAYLRTVKKTKTGTLIESKCLDPSIATGEIFKQAHSVILMSGTLKPGKMYRDILGLKKEDTIIKEYSSPFPKTNKLNIIQKDVTTKYEKREEKEYEKIGKRLTETIESTPGNTAIFFPSYKMLDRITPYINFDKEVIKQENGLNAKETKKLIEKFKSKAKEGAVLLGVTGGSFAEGIDFPGEHLLTVAIVGIPLQEPNLETTALIRYYDLKFGMGWDYGYIFPAMSKAIQASGRVIRTEKDRGVSIFLDERFTWKKYGKAFPNDFNFIINEKSPGKIIKKFWEN